MDAADRQQIVTGIVDGLNTGSSKIPRLQTFKPTGDTIQKARYVEIYIRTLKEQMAYLYDNKETADNLYGALIFCGGFLISEINQNNTLTNEEKEGKNKFEQLELKINKIYQIDDREIVARNKFFNLTQRSGEPWPEFLQRAKDIHQECNFDGTEKDKLLRDKLVQATTLSKVRYRALERKSNLADVVAHGDSLTWSEALSDEISNKTSHVNKVNFDYNKSHGFKGQRSYCYYCGNSPTHSRENCPAKDKDCLNCQEIGHFARRCPKNQNKGQNKGQYKGHNQNRNQGHHSKRKFHGRKRNFRRNRVHKVEEKEDPLSFQQSFVDALP